VPAVVPEQSQIMPWLKPAAWNDLPGWQDDDLAAAWPALLQSCRVLQRRSGWHDVCVDAARLNPADSPAIRIWIESRFKVWQIQQADGGTEGLVTGYYEPLLHGSAELTPKYRFPLYAPPDDLLLIDLGSLYPELKNLRLRGRLDGRKVVPYYSRQEIDSGKAPVAGKELA
jgi:membrane-bound lytic murein transglycosylase A